MTLPPIWTPDTRSNAQLQAQWVELRKETGRVAGEELDAICAQMQWIVDELETRRKHGIVVT